MAEVRVSGADSAIVGQLVQAEVVPDPGQDPDELTARIHAACREGLADFKRPRLIKVVERLVSADTMKVARRTGSADG